MIRYNEKKAVLLMDEYDSKLVLHTMEEVSNIWCRLEDDLSLIDEYGDVFKIETVGMVHYQKIENYKKFTELVLSGNVEEIGEILHLEKG